LINFYHIAHLAMFFPATKITKNKYSCISLTAVFHGIEEIAFHQSEMRPGETEIARSVFALLFR